MAAAVTKAQASRWGGRGWALLILGLALMCGGFGADIGFKEFTFEGATFTFPILVGSVVLLCLAAEPAGHIISKTKFGKN